MPAAPTVAASGLVAPAATLFAADDDARVRVPQISKMFGLDLQQLVEINKKRYPMLTSGAKLKKDTLIVLPPPEWHWILTKRIEKRKPEGKKKHVYTVQDIESPYQTFEHVEGHRVQDYPQQNFYKINEVVCALYPNVQGEALASDSTHWLTEFYPAILLKLLPHASNPTKALLKFQNDAHSLDHEDPTLERVVPLTAIIKREKTDDASTHERTEIDITDPRYPEIGLRKFLWDSMTGCWHDSLDPRWPKIRFKCKGAAAVVLSEKKEKKHERPQTAAGDYVYVEGGYDSDNDPLPPARANSPPRMTEEQVRDTLLRHGLYVVEMSFDGPPAGATTSDVPADSADGGGDGDTEMQDVGNADAEADRAEGDSTMPGAVEEDMLADDRAKPKHMQWLYTDAAGRQRSWFATRAIDTTQEPAPYLVLF